MPRIRCRYEDCAHLDDGFCGANSVELDPDEGCLTYIRVGEVPEEEDWEGDDLDEMWVEEDEELFLEDDEETDAWLEEDAGSVQEE